MGWGIIHEEHEGAQRVVWTVSLGIGGIFGMGFVGWWLDPDF